MSSGHFRRYVDKKFRADSLALLDVINSIIDEYSAGGYSLTVRQTYYQLVARGLIPNNGKSYDRVQGLISDGRLAGLVSWTAIEDRGRTLRGYETQRSPGAAVRQAAAHYKLDLWAGQRFRPEVWVEKAALEGVVERICSQLRVDFYATRGYDSQSQSWAAGRRFADYVARGQTPVVLHLGDHDPSGIDMTRDNTERLALFAGFRVSVVRIALNYDQVLRYAPPPNPAKMSDSRAESYVRQYGDESWELDALDPRVMQDLIEEHVLRMRDEQAWSERLAEEVADKRLMEEFAEQAGG